MKSILPVTSRVSVTYSVSEGTRLRVSQESTDEELMRAYQEGDSRAFEILFGRHSSRIYGFLLSHLKDRAKADDVFQETFLKLHKARHHYDPSFPLMPWLFTVAKSAMLDAFRKSKAIKEDASEKMPELAVGADADLKLEAPDLSGLNDSQRAAIEYRYREDLSFEEIAKRLETSPANVRQLISRGIKKLKSLRKGEGT